MRGSESRAGWGTTTKLALLAVAIGLAAPGSAAAETRNVAIVDNSFPFRVLALTGDTVTWKNEGRNVHNVTFDDGQRSDNLPPGQPYSRTFTAPGSHPYRCTLHHGMRGTVSVAHLHLSGPATPVRYGATATFTGLAPASATVEIKRGTEVVRTATAAGDGKFSARVPATVPGQYFATADGRTSAAVALKVRSRVALATRRSGATVYVNVSTTPAQVGAPVVLQRRTSSGWARVASARLNSRSKATFRVVPRARMALRVQLTRGVQGYSPSTSATITIRP